MKETWVIINRNLRIAASIFALQGCSPDISDSKLDEIMRDFQLEEGMEIQLVAREPVVIDPVAFAFDERGRLFVVEHRGYPDPAEGGKPAKREGRVAQIEDSDSDGVYETRTEFASDLSYPNGIMPWKGGVFVTCAPDIFYMKDTDGDGTADVKEVVLTGFYDTQTAQIRMSHPILGLDGWIYVTGGLNGGEIHSPKHPERTKITYRTGDGRFHPETLEFQVVSGKSQFGLTFDSFGRRFGCSNRHPVQHAVMELPYLNRHPYLLFNETIKDVSPVQDAAVVFPISGAATTADFIPKLIGRSHQGTFTSASGLLIYGDHSLGPGHQGNVFICEPAQNLIQRQVIVPEGVSFRSEVAMAGKEFLASRDEWFRPVFLTHGPQSGLYIADMHRKVIDHPSYVPEEIRGDLDYESGWDMGRIYRIKSVDHHSESDGLPFSWLGPAESTSQRLTSDSEWLRALAHRILLERKDTSVSSVLREMVRQAPLAESRVRAIWILHYLGTLKQITLENALSDISPEVREQAVYLIGTIDSPDVGLLTRLLEMAEDPNIRVRYMTSLVLGSLPGRKVVEALSVIAAKDGDDPWVRAAVLSGLNGRMEAFIHEFESNQDEPTEADLWVLHDLAKMFGTGESLTDCASLFRSITKSWNQIEKNIVKLSGLLEGMRLRAGEQMSNSRGNWLLHWERSLSSIEKVNFGHFLQEVVRIALDETIPAERRKQAIGLLAYLPSEISFPVLEDLVTDHVFPDLQREAVNALTKRGEIAGAKMLTKPGIWSGFTPQLQTQVTSQLLARTDYLEIMFDALEQGIIVATEIGSADRARLLNHKNEAIRHRSEGLFRELESGSRMKVYEAYKASLSQESHAVNGNQVFIRACSSCHSYGGVGGRVGPDLTGVKNQPADALLLHILVPNYEVYPTFQAIALETLTGETLVGRIQAESDHSLTLQTASGEEVALLRSNVRSFNNLGKSLMPDGFELTITPQEMNDLIAFLKSGG